MNPVHEKMYELLKQVGGYIYPNEIEVHWGILVVVYPYLTGLVAGAFILASLVKVFNIKEVQAVYRLSLLTALAFLLIAPLPLLLHLGHPTRSYEIFLNPNFTSAMAMFGFVYEVRWLLVVVGGQGIGSDVNPSMNNYANSSTVTVMAILLLLAACRGE